MNEPHLFSRTARLPELSMTLLDAALRLSDAAKGNVQILNAAGALVIKAHRGFRRPFLDFFSEVHAGRAACGAAMKTAGQIVVEDVLKSPLFEDPATGRVMKGAGVRAVQSTPILAPSGALIGVVSTHNLGPTRFDAATRRALRRLADEFAAAFEAASPRFA